MICGKSKFARVNVADTRRLHLMKYQEKKRENEYYISNMCVNSTNLIIFGKKLILKMNNLDEI